MLKKIFGKKKLDTSNNSDEKTAKEEKSDSVAVKFSVRTLDIDGFPFELMINTELNDATTRENYDWLWTVTIKSLDSDKMGLPSDNERKKLMGFMKKIIQTVLKETDIKIVGTSLHKETYDIMFYGKNKDSAIIGGTIAEMPSYMEDVKGRFLNFKGVEDINWEKVQGYYNVFQQ